MCFCMFDGCISFLFCVAGVVLGPIDCWMGCCLGFKCKVAGVGCGVWESFSAPDRWW